MRSLLVTVLAACGSIGTAPSATTPPSVATTPTATSDPGAALDPALEPLRGLLGSWAGRDPDQASTGHFTLEADLGGKLLVRRGRNDSPKGRHDDLMVVFPTPAGLRAAYFDNEGHIIQYAVTTSAQRIELISDAVPGQPRFRLRYDIHGRDELAIDFAIAPPGGTEFAHYLGGIVNRY